MKDETQLVKLVEVREKVRYEEQIADQVEAYRKATLEANPAFMQRCVLTLGDLMWPWIPEADRTRFEELAPNKSIPSDFYTTHDKEKIKIYGTLDSTRKRELIAAAQVFTTSNHNKACRKQFRLLARTMKHMGLSLKETGEERVGGGLDPASSFILSSIHHRVHKLKLNFLCLITGHVGFGKSMVGCMLSKLLDGSFNLSKVRFNVDSVLDIVDRDGYPKGTAFVCDEVGSFFERRRAMSNRNLTLSHLIQTFRSRQYITFWTLPQKNMVDSHLLQMADALIEVKEVNRDTREVLCSFKWLKPSSKGNNVMYSFPKKPREGIDPLYLTKFYVGHPNDGKRGMPGFETRYKKKKNSGLKDMTTRDRKILHRDERRTTGESIQNKKYSYTCTCGHRGATDRPKPRCGRCHKLAGVVVAPSKYSN